MRAGFCLPRPRLGPELCPPGAAALGIRVPFRVLFPDCYVADHPKECGPSSMGSVPPPARWAPGLPRKSQAAPLTWLWFLGWGILLPTCRWPPVGSWHLWHPRGRRWSCRALEMWPGGGGPDPTSGRAGQGEGRQTPPRAAGGRGRVPEPEFADAGNWWPCLAVTEYASLGFFRLLACKGRGRGLKFLSLYIESGTSQ